MGRLDGKVCLVTGAGQGIGRETALHFAREGAKVIATDLNEAAVLSLAKEHANITGLKLDVTNQDEIKALAARVGYVEVLFNCAGFVHHGTALSTTNQDWAFSLQLNVTSMFWMVQAFLPAMVARNKGCVINMASVAGTARGVPNRFVYSTTKGAVVALTKSVACDYVKQGVRCNCISPGTVQTPSLNDRIAALGDAETARKAFIARQPLGRLGKPEEIALLATYLASDEAAFTTGQEHIIDGGWSCL